MKKILYMAVVIVMSLSVGCKDKTVERTAEITEVLPKWQERPEEIQFTETDFYSFFAQYFSLSEEEILSLNRNYPRVDSAYWQNLESYKQSILDKIGNYLSADVKKKLGEQYLCNEIQLPKKLMINDYVTYGSGRLEKVEIISTRLRGEDIVYEVAATTVNPVQNLRAFEENYVWAAETGYYDLRENVLSQTGSVLTYSENEEMPEADDYIYAVAATDEKKDEIKLIQKYWVTVASGEFLKIKSIQEVQPIMVQENARAKATCNQHVTRVAYKVTANVKERMLIEKIFNQMMGCFKEDFKYYHKALETGYEAVKLFWEEKGLLEEMILEPTSYASAFSDTINPYKDNIIAITVTADTIQIIPSIYSTKMQMRFMVTLPIKALLSNNEIVYYKYKYFVGMDGDKVEFIEFVNMESLTEENYNASMSNVSRH